MLCLIMSAVRILFGSLFSSFWWVVTIIVNQHSTFFTREPPLPKFDTVLTVSKKNDTHSVQPSKVLYTKPRNLSAHGFKQMWNISKEFFFSSLWWYKCKEGTQPWRKICLTLQANNIGTSKSIKCIVWISGLFDNKKPHWSNQSIKFLK